MFVCRQLVTSAAIDDTFARGPSVAARSGIPVLANHQSLGAWCDLFHLGCRLSWCFGVVGDRDVEKRRGADVGACAVRREGAGEDAGGATSLLSDEGGFSVSEAM
jgi:hypothetical protein